MKLSAPLYALKRQAKALSRGENIPLHQALDRIAAREGFSGWSLLMARATVKPGPEELFARLEPGDVLLLGARPRQGKTLMALRLAVQAMKAGNRVAFFTLDYTGNDVAERFRAIGENPAGFGGLFSLDTSETIHAGTIMERLDGAPRGTLVVIDYLQLLDQKRENPPLTQQVAALKSFARERGIAIVFLSQIDRSFDPAAKPVPDLDDVRLPNPLDLKLFDKTCFLHGKEVRFAATG